MKNVVFSTVAFMSLCCLISCSVNHQKSDSRDLIPRSVLLAKPDRCFVQINKAGDKISYVSRCDGGVSLNVADLNGKIIVSVKVKPVRDLGYYRWASTDNHILFLQDRNGDENNHIHCLDIKTGKVTDITPFSGVKADILQISKKHPNEILIGLNKEKPEWYDLYRLNILTGEMSLVYKNREFSSFFCSLAPSILCDDDFKPVLARKAMKDGSVEYRIMKKGRWQLWQKIPYEDSKTTEFLTLSRDCKKAYRRDSLGRDHAWLVEQDLQTGENKVLFKHDLADVTDSSVLYDDDIHPQVIAIEYTKSELFGLTKAAQRTVDQLKERAAGKEIYTCGSNSANSMWLIALVSDVQSTEFFLCSRDAKSGTILSFKKLFSAQPELDKYKLYPMEPVIIKSRDGLNLVCYLTKAKNFQNGVPAKLIVYPHGGPWYRDSWGFDKEAQLLADRGYSVISVNYRGSVGFGKNFINAADRNLDKMHNDLIDAVNWCIENKIADKDQVAIYGGSYGGYSVLRGLTENAELFRCGVDVVGVSNWATVFKTFPAYWIPEAQHWYKWAGDPNTEEGRRSLKENSPISHIQNIRKPILVLQGQHDPRVSRAESDQIVKEIKANKVPVTYIMYPDEGHGFGKEANSKSSYYFTEKFFAKTLGGSCEPMTEEEAKLSSHQVLEDDNGCVPHTL
ncbi:peptidase S9 [Alphaproteobacteria bacterium]|nr:peptidase S9 [Alphaproteobacteria bacterium]